MKKPIKKKRAKTRATAKKKLAKKKVSPKKAEMKTKLGNKKTTARKAQAYLRNRFREKVKALRRYRSHRRD